MSKKLDFMKDAVFFAKENIGTNARNNRSLFMIYFDLRVRRVISGVAPIRIGMVPPSPMFT